MHPLDAFPLEGFAMTASTQFVVRRPFAEVWTLLGIGTDEPLGLPKDAEHRIVQRYGPGEHRCSVIGVRDGRAYCARGFRRVSGGHEVLEVQQLADEDRLVRTSFEALRRGRTGVVVNAGQRALPGRSPHPDAQQRWSRVLQARHDQAEQALLAYG